MLNRHNLGTHAPRIISTSAPKHLNPLDLAFEHDACVMAQMFSTKSLIHCRVEPKILRLRSAVQLIGWTIAVAVLCPMVAFGQGAGPAQTQPAASQDDPTLR